MYRSLINLLNFKIMDKLNKIYEEWVKLNIELFQESKDYIKKMPVNTYRQ